MATMTLSTRPLVDPTADVHDSKLGAYTQVGARTKLLEVTLDDYSYVVNDSDIAYTTFGKFCSIAAMTRINPGNHPMHRATQSHVTYQASAYFPGEQDEAQFFAWRRAHPVVVGHDVWVGHGAIILPGRTIGTRRRGEQGCRSLCHRRRQSGPRRPATISRRDCGPAAATGMVELGSRAAARGPAGLPAAIDRELSRQV